ncbi:hypothetical protein KP509_06G024000 [Ceratopteris richardii]|uniref:VLRF1 domain-containing protein n=1 Tax=Ceratopteris richardii TaxID=49495 RepID=A0A8T2UIR2_CERRI|nr:hypothetical protein KP509_06G024000 [Ceratopteris richardii]
MSCKLGVLHATPTGKVYEEVQPTLLVADELTAKMNDEGRTKPSSLLEVPSFFFDGARVVFDNLGLGIAPNRVAKTPQSCISEISSTPPDFISSSSMSKWTCNTCNKIEFSSLEEQRSHFKSDLHRFNVKRKLIGKDPLSEELFEIHAAGQIQKEDDVSSISGSDEEDSDSCNEGEVPHSKAFSASNVQTYISVILQSSKEIVTFFKCVVLKDNERLGRHDLGTGDTVGEEELLQRLKKFVCKENPPEGNSLWLILLLRGGHFAGCVFDSKNGSILAHKTYHRYVVRARAGGKQSTRDGTGRAPKSAGASLRRHNEASLQKEVRELLLSWKSYFEAASCIFVHAPSRNSSALFGGDGSPLNWNDGRVRRIPLTTRRPTFKEAKRIFNELNTITYEKVDNSSNALNFRENPLQEADADNKMEAAVQKAEDASELISCLDESLETSNSHIDSAATNAKTEIISSPLHDAARSGQVDLVLELLRSDANPCIKDSRGRTPYDIAADKETRNVFRRFMASNLELWDWHAANVPSPLTDEMEAAKAAKQAEKDAKRKAKAKEQKKLRKAKLKSRETAAATSSERVSSEDIGKTTDSCSLAGENAKSKADVEREKRALAAERRMKALSLAPVPTAGSNLSSTTQQDGPFCSCCGVSLAGMTPFYRLKFRYCTTVCVNAHRLSLES